jgi:hypothetical protein
MYAYFISGPKNVDRIFRSSKSLSTDFLRLEAFRNVVGLSKVDLAIFEADTSGPFAIPLSNVPENKRIWRQIHENQDHQLSSPRQLDVLMDIFSANFEVILDNLPNDQWTTVLIYKFVRKAVSTASTIALMGKWPFQNNNEFIDDFWAYFEGIIALFMRLPRFLNPKVFEARERLTAACIEHLKGLDDEYNEIQKRDMDWETNLGAKVNRLRDKTLLDAGMSMKGRGALLAGFLIGYEPPILLLYLLFLDCFSSSFPFASWNITG